MVARLVEEHDGICYVAPEADYQHALANGQPVEPRLGFPEDDVEPA